MNPDAHGLLEQARTELAAVERRVTALRTLLDDALEAVQPEERRVGGADDASNRTSQARSMASHMALSGYPRWSAEDRLRGTVGRRALREILDQVYGPRSRDR